MVMVRQEIEMQMAQGQNPEALEKLRGLTWGEAKANPTYLAIWENEGLLARVGDSVQIEEESDRVALAFQSCLITCPLFDGKEAQVEWAVRYRVDWKNNPASQDRKSPIVTGASFAIRPVDPDLSYGAFQEFAGLVRQALRRGM